FYSVFDLQTGANTSCKFFNVWVCVYDSTCGGVCEPEVEYESSCPDNPDAALYKNKQRRYPEYVNLSVLTSQLLSGNVQQQSDEAEDVVAEQFASNCESQADYWISVLKGCGINSTDSALLRAALIEICTKGASYNAPFGSSSIPSTVSSTYHSFEE